MDLCAYDVRATIPVQITHHRRQQGWTSAELARRAGISKASLCEIEHARKLPGPVHLVGLAQALGLTASELLGDARPERGGDVMDLCTITVTGEEDYYAMTITDRHGRHIAGATAPSIQRLADALTDALIAWGHSAPVRGCAGRSEQI